MPAPAAARSVAAVAVAVGVLVAAVVAIAVLGRATPPELPSLADEPDPPVRGELAVLAGADDDDRTCLSHVTLPAADETELHCDAADLRDVGWADRDTIQATAHHDGGLVRVVTVDVGDGAVTERIVPRGEVPATEGGEVVEPYGPAERADGRRATVGHDEPPTVTVMDAAGRVRGEHRVAGGRHYRLDGVGWSPDGRWLVVADSADRLLVLDERAANPRVLLEDVRAAAWRPR